MPLLLNARRDITANDIGTVLDPQQINPYPSNGNELFSRRKHIVRESEHLPEHWKRIAVSEIML
jgi:hypothetical protein